MDVAAYLAERGALVDAVLERALPSANTPPQRLHAAMRHLLFPGGKRLRPALAIAAAEAVGAPPERALALAAAVELVHTYSLVHDDLPCMDDDLERRGRPTVHVAFGEAVAVLAGDALLAAAFEVLASAPEVPAEALLLAARDLARAAGSLALVGGQVDDLAFQAGRASLASVESIHERKSAALIAASIVGGARLAGASSALLERLRRFGLAVGIAFQIADDLLDERQDGAEETGGDAGCSLVPLVGVQAARERAEALLGSALESIEDLGQRAEPLRELARFAVRRDR
ncbi:MAG TPA: polyprenyl synthetase family protein [Myxococcota bacterium]|nr:polyprenyl synthetase family protein [Myxococcota bacterium]